LHLKNRKVIYITCYLLFRFLIGLFNSQLLLFSSWMTEYIDIFLLIPILLLMKDDIVFQDSNIDSVSIVILIIGFTLFRVLIIYDVRLIPLTVIFICLTVVLILKNPKIIGNIKSINVRNLIYQNICGILLGLVIGFSLVVIRYTLENTFEIGTLSLSQVIATILQFSLSITYYFAKSAVLEEPIFRGYLYGYLTNRRVKFISYLIIQTIIFMICHMNYINRPVTFWVVLPISSIILGVSAKISKSLILPIWIHTLINSSILLSPIIMTFLYK
jgi:membrane protease YdiL (CAAX protease family)